MGATSRVIRPNSKQDIRIPVLTKIIHLAAGAYGIKFRPFLIWAFLAKVVRYWLLIIIVVGVYELIS